MRSRTNECMPMLIFLVSMGSHPLLFMRLFTLSTTHLHLRRSQYILTTGHNQSFLEVNKNRIERIQTKSNTSPCFASPAFA